MSNIRDICKNRLLVDMIRTIQPDAASSWKVLVVDQEAMRIISAACKMYDITEENITIVEKIDMVRQPLTDLEAIYFITPTTDSVDRLVGDFKKKPMYAAAHVFFTSKLGDSEFQKLSNSAVASKIKTLKELNLEFIPVEAQAFHFDMNKALTAFFSPNSAESPKYQYSVANKLVSLMATLNEYPVIRFARGQPLATSLATAVQSRLDNLVRSAVGFTPNEDRATLLILDRTADPVSPLLHEFSYQAMVNDLLPINNDIWEYDYQSGAGSQSRKVLLTESDPLWSLLRHMHIADTTNWIVDNFNEFMKNNKVTSFTKNSEVSSIKEMSEAMKAMPQYKELLDKYSLHMNLASEAMKKFNDQGLERIAGVEQDMATGSDAEGRTAKNVISALTPIFSDPEVPKDLKMRLMMIYIISQDGIKEQDRKRLAEMSGFKNDDVNTLVNLSYLGVTLQKGAQNKKTKKDTRKKKKRSEDISFDLSRFVPQIKDVVDDLIQGNLSPADYPFVKEDQAEVGSSSKSSGGGNRMSLKGAGSKQPRWADKDKSKKKDDKPQLQGPRVIVFMAGGMTYSEMRSMYELSQAHQRIVFIGSTHILTPQTFLKDLAELKKLGSVS